MKGPFIHSVVFEALSLVMNITLKINRQVKILLGGNFRRVLKHFHIRKSQRAKEPKETDKMGRFHCIRNKKYLEIINVLDL